MRLEVCTKALTVRVREVGGSNPPTPTKYNPKPHVWQKLPNMWLMVAKGAKTPLLTTSSLIQPAGEKKGSGSF